ncbi:MAG: hypothetical protein M3392_06170, partial [Actinomycetota bacterium]|nr:hypothetical protein [Actinomycetota bacterium]
FKASVAFSTFPHTSPTVVLICASATLTCLIYLVGEPHGGPTEPICEKNHYVYAAPDVGVECGPETNPRR